MNAEDEQPPLVRKLTRAGLHSSKYKGVGYKKSSGKWQVVIKKDGKSHWCGEYDSEEEAADAYDRAAIELYGGNVVLNRDLKLMYKAIDQLSQVPVPEGDP